MSAIYHLTLIIYHF